MADLAIRRIIFISTNPSDRAQGIPSEQKQRSDGEFVKLSFEGQKIISIHS
jgi:hypothetical protein